MTTYKDAGVDTALKAATLSALKDRVKAGRPEVIGGLGGFGGLFRAPTGKEVVLVATTDGVGTKTDLARLLDRHEVIGTDVVHQSINDAVATGAEPLFFLDYFATSKLDAAIFNRIVGAIGEACAAHNCALLGGETAEMPGTYMPGAYDLAGFLVGAVEKERLLGPSLVKEGDALIGIPSSGLHTNGYSLARLIVARLADVEGCSVEETLRAPRPGLGVPLGDALLAPHRSYLSEVKALREAADVHSIAHLTGGGWEGNLPRALPDTCDAEIERDSFEVPSLFTFLGDTGDVHEDERFSTWNMGIGLIVAVDRADRDAALRATPGAVLLGQVVQRDPRAERRVRFL